MSSLRLRMTHEIVEIPAAVRLLSVISLLAFLAATTACSNVLPAAPPASSTSQQRSSARILLSPTSASVPSGGKLQFTALIQNSSNTEVRWFATAGTISANGLFYAPKVTHAEAVTVSVAEMENPRGPDQSLPLTSTSVTVTSTEALTISTRDLRAATSGSSYSEQLSSGGGTAPFSWSISSGALPQGIQLNASSGVISGFTSQTGTFPFTVSVKDASSHQAAQALALTVSATTAGPCGPPTYGCAASTSASAVVPLPLTLPTWAANTGSNAGNPLFGAGVSVTTTEFGSPTTIFRLTDLTNNCNPNASTFYSSGQVANSGSGDETHFNTDSTLVVLGGSGGWVCPEAVTIAGSSLSFSRIDNNFSFPNTTNSVTPSYNSSAPNLMYAMNNTVIQTYDFTGYGPNVTAPAPSTYYDFTTSANCLGGSYGVPTWVDHLSNAKYPPDSMFGEAFSNAGGQGTGFDVVAYKPGSGCVHLNTKTGVITGDWGTTGTIGIPDRFLIHNALLSKNGQWMLITYSVGGCLTTCTANSGDPYLWQVGTTNLYVGCSSSAGGKCGGHWTEGSKNYVNVSGAFTYQEEIRAIDSSSPHAPTDLISGIATCSGTSFGAHLGWPNVDSEDSYPFLGTTSSTETGLPGNTFTCPFLSEVDLVSPAGAGFSSPGSGTVFREAHTFNSGQQTSEFSCEYAIGSISTDGRIAIWESDGLGAFGSTSGGSNCSGTTCRCEVVGMLLQ
jgi:hypothetical protein